MIRFLRQFACFALPRRGEEICAKPQAAIAAIVVMGISITAFGADSDPINRGGLPSNTPAASHASSFDMMRVVLALGAVIVLISVLKWAAKKYLGQAMPAKHSGAVQVLSKNAVGPKSAILLVQVGRRVVLVGDSGTQMSTLSEIQDSDEVAELIGQVRREKTDSASHVFGKLFGKAEKDFDTIEEDPVVQDERPEQDVTEVREELSGLADRVRGLARQFQKV